MEPVYLDLVLIAFTQATLLPQELTQAWQKHLRESQINPLFDNWAIVYTLTSEQESMTEIKDFIGVSLNRHQLHQRVMERGYLPKTEEFEHGWIFEYRKKFISLNLEVVIDFSGDSPASEENFDVQLGDVYIWQGRRVPLTEVSPILLSLVWSEISAIVRPN